MVVFLGNRLSFFYDICSNKAIFLDFKKTPICSKKMNCEPMKIVNREKPMAPLIRFSCSKAHIVHVALWPHTSLCMLLFLEQMVVFWNRWPFFENRPSVTKNDHLFHVEQMSGTDVQRIKIRLSTKKHISGYKSSGYKKTHFRLQIFYSRLQKNSFRLQVVRLQKNIFQVTNLNIFLYFCCLV